MEIKSMPMEAETIPMLIGGFSIIIVIVFTFILFLLIKRRNPIYAWFIGQTVSLCLGFIYVLKVLSKSDVVNSMVSEDISLSIGLAALFWAISMICMIVGIWKLSKREKV